MNCFFGTAKKSPSLNSFLRSERKISELAPPPSYFAWRKAHKGQLEPLHVTIFSSF